MSNILDITNYTRPHINNKSAHVFSSLSTCEPFSFTEDKLVWKSISHYIYGNMLNSIPSFKSSTYKNYNIPEPYDKYYEDQKTLSFYTSDLYNIICEFIKECPNLLQKVNLEKSYKTNTNNTILKILSSDDYNLSIYYKKIWDMQQSISQTEYMDQSIDINIIREFYIIIQGLKHIMYNKSNYNNLERYKDFTYSQIKTMIIEMYGNTFISTTINNNNLYTLYKNKELEYNIIYEKLLSNPNLKDHLVKLFILKNYEKYNLIIEQENLKLAFKSNIKDKLNIFIEQGEETDDYDTDTVPYSLSDKEYVRLFDLSINKLSYLKDKLNIKQVSSYQKINTSTINTLFAFLKTIKTDKSKNVEEDVEEDVEEEEEEENVFHLFGEEQIPELEDIIEDHHPGSPIYTSRTTISSITFTNLLEYIYYKEFLLLLSIITIDPETVAYDLVKKNTIIDYDMVHTNLKDRVTGMLFDKVIKHKLLKNSFKITLFLSKPFIILDRVKSISNKLQILTTDQKSIPDNWIRIINVLIKDHKGCFDFLNIIIHHIINMIACMCYNTKDKINNNMIIKLINVWYSKKFNFKECYLIPKEFKTFHYKCQTLFNESIKNVEKTFNYTITTTLHSSISSHIFSFLQKFINHINTFKSNDFKDKCYYFIQQTQKIDLNRATVEMVFNELDPYFDNRNVITSVLLGEPILTDEHTLYLQRSSKSIPILDTAEYFNLTKFFLYTFINFSL
jgi:hypothetical protein